MVDKKAADKKGGAADKAGGAAKPPPAPPQMWIEFHPKLSACPHTWVVTDSANRGSGRGYMHSRSGANMRLLTDVPPSAEEQGAAAAEGAGGAPPPPPEAAAAAPGDAGVNDGSGWMATRDKGVMPVGRGGGQAWGSQLGVKMKSVENDPECVEVEGVQLDYSPSGNWDTLYDETYKGRLDLAALRRMCAGYDYLLLGARKVDPADEGSADGPSTRVLVFAARALNAIGWFHSTLSRL